MSSQRVFQRSPRMVPSIPRGEEELRAPESPPTAPSTGLGARMEDVFFTGGASIAGAAFMAAFTHSGTSTMIGGASMFFFGVLRGVIGYRREVRNYKGQCASRTERQQSYLVSRRADFTKARDQQRQSMLQLNPDPLECLRRSENADLRLFERSPGEADFLSLRLGLGPQPFSVLIKTQAVDHLTKDPLALSTAALASEFSLVDKVPICANLRELGIAGVTGPRAQAVEGVRSLLVQLATHHSADEVKLAVIHPPEEDWSWLRWLPHVWNDDHGRRLSTINNITANTCQE